MSKTFTVGLGYYRNSIKAMLFTGSRKLVKRISNISDLELRTKKMVTKTESGSGNAYTSSHFA